MALSPHVKPIIHDINVVMGISILSCFLESIIERVKELGKDLNLPK